MTEEQVVELTQSSKSGREWDASCDKVKAACGGYPDFWFKAILQSGVAGRTLAKFGESDEIKLVVVE